MASTVKVPVIQSERKWIIFAEETIYNNELTAINPKGVLPISLSISPMEGNMIDRKNIRKFYGQAEQIATTPYVKIDLEVEMNPSGVMGTKPAIDLLLKACGFVSTDILDADSNVTGIEYKVTSDRTLYPSLSMYFNYDNINHTVTGCIGTFSITAKNNDLLKIKFSFTGIYNPITKINKPEDSASLSAQQSIHPLPITKDYTGMTFAGVSTYALTDFNVDLGANPTFMSFYGNVGSIVENTKRETKGDMTVLATPDIVTDWFDRASNVKTDAMEFKHGKDAGKIVKIVSPSVQIAKPSYQDDNGITMLKAPLNFVPLSGDDELSIIFA